MTKQRKICGPQAIKSQMFSALNLGIIVIGISACASPKKVTNAGASAAIIADCWDPRYTPLNCPAKPPLPKQAALCSDGPTLEGNPVCPATALLQCWNGEKVLTDNQCRKEPVKDCWDGTSIAVSGHCPISDYFPTHDSICDFRQHAILIHYNPNSLDPFRNDDRIHSFYERIQACNFKSKSLATQTRLALRIITWPSPNGALSTLSTNL